MNRLAPNSLAQASYSSSNKTALRSSWPLLLRLCLPRVPLVVVCVAGVLSPSVVHAQPAQVPLTDQQRQAGDQKRADFLKREVDPVLSTNAAGALSATRTFLTDNSNLHPEQRLALYRDVGAKVFDANVANVGQVQLDTDKALLSFLDEGVQGSAQLGGLQLRDRLLMQRLSVALLLRQNQLPSAQERLQNAWNEALSGDDFLSWVKLKRDLLTRQRQEKEGVPMILGAIEKRLELRHQFDPSLCLLMAQTLREQGQSAKSLSWGKLAFLLCPFYDGETSQAAQVLFGTWAYDLALDKIRAFVAAQSDASSPNPLDGVAVPVFDDKFKVLLNNATAAAKAQGDNKAVISLLIVQNDYRGAMLQARSRLAGDMGSEESVREVARVFKAKDASLVRANGFVSFYGSGQGQNPLPAFFQELDAGAPAPSVVPTPPATTPAAATTTAAAAAPAVATVPAVTPLP